MLAKESLWLLALLAVSLVSAGPLSPRTASKCATNCSVPTNFFYQNGKTYIYRFHTKTSVSVDKDFSAIEISGQAHIYVHGGCDYGLKVNQVTISGGSDNSDYVHKLQKETLLFSFDDGHIASVCPSVEEESWVLNVKKGLLSAIQTSTKVLGPKKVVQEVDILGECETEYTLLSQSYYEGTKVRKSKNLGTCKNHYMANDVLFMPKEIVEALASNQRLWMTGTYVCTQVIGQEGILRKSECVDKAKWDLVWSSRKIERESKVDITFHKMESGLPGSPSNEFRRDTLLYLKEDTPSMTSQSVRQLTTSLCEEVKESLTAKTYQSFEKLRKALKYLDYDKVKLIVSEVKTIKGCKVDLLENLVDSALMMSGGDGATKYILEKMDSLSNEDWSKMWSLLMLPFMDKLSIKTLDSLLPILRKGQSSPRMTLFISSAIGRVAQKTDQLTPAIEESINLISNLIPSNCDGQANQIESYLRSLGNIGRSTSTSTNKLLSCLRSQNSVIQVAAADAIRHGKLCVQLGKESVDIKKALENLMRHTYSLDSDEVLVAAFKAYMSCGSEEKILDIVLDIMKSKRNERLGAYIKNYLLDLKSSKTIVKLPWRQLLAGKQEIQDWTPSLSSNQKPSTHLEYSYYSDGFNLGFDVELDKIMSTSGSSVPKAVILKVDIPSLDKTVNLLEIGLRQSGLDGELEGLLRTDGPLSMDKLKELVKQVQDWETFKKNSEKLIQALSSLRNAIGISKELSMYVMFNGKTLLHLDSKDNLANDISSWSSANLNKLTKSKLWSDGNHLLALSFLNGCHKVPTISGLPIKYNAGGSLLMSTKLFANSQTVNILPSLVLGYSMSVSTLLAGDKEAGLSWEGTLSSNAGIKARASLEDGKYLKILELEWPEKEAELLQIKTGPYLLMDGQQRRPASVSLISDQTCSNAFFGLGLCIRKSKPQLEIRRSFLDKDLTLDIKVKRIDSNLKSWRAMLTYPKPGQSQMSYQVVFDTPGSKQDNKIDLRFRRELAVDNRIMYRFSLKYPHVKEMEADLSLRLTDKPLIQLTLIEPEGRHVYEISGSGTGKVDNGEYTGKLRIEHPNMKSPVEVDGNFQVKLQPNYNIKGEAFVANLKRNTRIRVLKAELKTEGVWLSGKWARNPSSLYKASLNIQAGNSKYRKWFNLASNLQRNSFISVDSVMDYKTVQMTKAQKMEIHGKFYDKGTDQMVQIQTMGEITSTQWSSVNGHFNQKLTYKPLEHLENELLMRWKGKMDDKKKKVHILQITKVQSKSGQMDKSFEMDNQVRVFIGPQDINYDLSYKLKSRRSQPGNSLTLVNHELELKNVDLSSQMYKGVLNYEMASRSPFRAVYGVMVKTPAGERSFSEEVKEIKPNQYSGKITVKSTVQGEAKYGYEIETLATSNRSSYSTDIAVKKIEGNQNVGNFKLDIKMQDLNEALISKLVYRNQEIFDVNLSRVDSTKIKAFVKLMTYGHLDLAVNKVESGVWKSKLQVRCNLHDMDHETLLTLVTDQGKRNYGYNFVSETKVSKKPFLTITVAQTWNQNFKATLSAENTNGELVMDKLSGDGRSLKLSLKGKDIVHSSMFSMESNSRKLSFKSGTKKGATQLGRIELNMQELYSRGEIHLTGYLNAFSGMDLDMNLKSVRREDLDLTFKIQRGLSTSSPIVYEIKGIKSERVKSLLVAKKVMSTTHWGLETLLDPTQFLFDLKNPYLTCKLTIGGDRSPHVMKLILSGQDGWFVHEAFLSSKMSEKNANFMTRVKVRGQDKFYINWSLTPSLNTIEVDNTIFNSILTLGDSQGSLEVTTKSNNKRRLLSLKRIKSNSEPNAMTLELDILFDANHNPGDRYTAKATIPTKVEKKMIAISFESKEPSFCETKLTYKVDEMAEESFKLGFDRRCPRSHKVLLVVQKRNGKSYQHLAEYKENGVVILGIDSKSKFNRRDNLVSLKLQTKSTNKNLDGAYVDLKSEPESSRGINAILAVKPPFIQKLITINVELKQGGSSWSFISTVDGTIETIGTMEKRKFKKYFRFDREVDIDVQYQYQANNNQLSPVWSSKIFLGDKVSVSMEYIPKNIKLDYSQSWTLVLPKINKHESNLLIVYESMEMIKLSGQLQSPKTLELVTIKGHIIGYPVSLSFDQTKASDQCKLSIKNPIQDHHRKYPNTYKLNLEPHEKDILFLSVDINQRSSQGSLRTILRLPNWPLQKLECESVSIAERWTKKLIYKQDDHRYGVMVSGQAGKEMTTELFLKERTVKLERKTEKINEALTSLWLDASRKPADKFLLQQKFDQHSSNRAIRTIKLDHSSLKMPIKLSVETDLDESILKLKSSLDFSTNPGENLFLELEYPMNVVSDHKESMTKIQVFRADRQLDFSWESNLQLKSGSEEKTVKRLTNSKWKASSGIFHTLVHEMFLKLTTKKLSIKEIVKPLSSYFSCDAEIGLNEELPLVTIEKLDVAFQEHGPVYRITSDIKKWPAENRKCMMVNFFLLGGREADKSSGELCLSGSLNTKEPIMDLSIKRASDSGSSLAEVKVTKNWDPENTYRVSLIWNPESVGTLFVDATRALDKIYTDRVTQVRDMKKEFSNQVNLVYLPIKREILDPLMDYSRKEMTTVWDEVPTWMPQNGLNWIPGSSGLRLRSKRSAYSQIKSWTQSGNYSELPLKTLLWALNFKLISNNPDNGEIIFDIGNRYIL